MPQKQNLENKISVREKGFNLKERLKKGAASLLIGASLIGLSGCATTNSNVYAQQNKPSEQYEEIDYENMNLLYSDKVVGKPDFYKGKVVFSVLIKPGNLDLFYANRDGSEQKRITCTNGEIEQAAFNTTDNKVAFASVGNTNKSLKRYVMDQNGENKKEITEQVYFALAKERGIDIVKDLY